MAADSTAVLDIIQATLAPIFLVSGGALFLNFVQARLFRVKDRLRAVGKELAHASPSLREDLRWQWDYQVRRAVILRNAILSGILVIVFTVATALLLLLLASEMTTRFDAGKWPLYTFSLALIAFAAALGLVTMDAFLSVASAGNMAREFHEAREG